MIGPSFRGRRYVAVMTCEQQRNVRDVRSPTTGRSSVSGAKLRGRLTIPFRTQPLKARADNAGMGWMKDYLPLGADDQPFQERPRHAPGKRTLTMGMPVSASGAGFVQRKEGATPARPIAPVFHEDPFGMHLLSGPVQFKATSGQADDQVHAAATRGLEGPATSLPFLNLIQASFGAEHDVSQIEAHVGGAAAEASEAMGASAYATGNHVAFGGTPDLHTAAHEAAHVVQQRAGVHLKDGVGEAGDSYERHADAVADAVVRGESAAPLLAEFRGGGMGASRVQQRAVQFFGAGEHKAAGDFGSGGQSYKKKGLELTHGDLTMLRGDHFSEADILALWAKPSVFPGRLKGTQDEIICAIHMATGGRDARFAEDGPWHGLTFSDAVTKAVEEKYFGRASVNDEHFANPRLPQPGEGFQPGSSPATYRDAHERAIYAAFRAGASGVSIDDAMILEAMGGHYLTDAFAAGHISSPRTEIREYWNTKYPNFGAQFKAKVTADMAAHLKETALAGSAQVPLHFYEGVVGDQINEKLAGKPDVTLGDMVGLVAHDYDNDNGLWVVNDLGYRWMAKGDGNLDAEKPAGAQRTHASIVLEAVRAGVEDVRTAYSLGAQNKTTPLMRDQVLALVRDQPIAPATPGAKYAPEQFMPREDPSSAQGKQYWRAGNIQALWNMNVRDGAPTYGELIVAGFRGGTAGDELDAIAASIPEKQAPIPLAQATAASHMYGPRAHLMMGMVYPRTAFVLAVTSRLKNPDSCLAFILEVVGEA